MSSPFVSRKNILIQNKFDEELNDDDVIFIDLFLRFNRIGYLSSVIVDSMFFVDYKNTNETNFTSLAIKWNLNEIQYDDKVYIDSKSFCKKNLIKNFDYCKEYERFKSIESLLDFCKKTQIFCYLPDDNSVVFNSNNLTIFYYNSHFDAKNNTLVEKKLINYSLENENLALKFVRFEDLIGKIFYKKYL